MILNYPIRMGTHWPLETLKSAQHFIDGASSSNFYTVFLLSFSKNHHLIITQSLRIISLVFVWEADIRRRYLVPTQVLYCLNFRLTNRYIIGQARHVYLGSLIYKKKLFGAMCVSGSKIVYINIAIEKSEFLRVHHNFLNGM